jgi:hypothetical protein
VLRIGCLTGSSIHFVTPQPEWNIPKVADPVRRKEEEKEEDERTK